MYVLWLVGLCLLENVSLEIKGPYKDGVMKYLQSFWGSASSSEPCLGLGLGFRHLERGGQGWHGVWVSLEEQVSLEGFVLQESCIRGSFCFQKAPLASSSGGSFDEQTCKPGGMALKSRLAC